MVYVFGKQAGRGGTRGGAEDDDDAAGLGGVDVADPRFAKLFSSHQFALDPTHPRCVRSLFQLYIDEWLCELKIGRAHV